MSDWDDYGGAKPPSKLTLALVVGVFVVIFGTMAFAELVGAHW